MWKYALTLSYVGTPFCGWQRQKTGQSGNRLSIQEIIETVLARITQEPVSVVASGRTDAGVHAAAQVAHIRLTKKNWDPSILQRGLNSLLPSEIRVLDLEEVPLEFHAQKSAQKKQYSYYFQQGPSALPALMPYSWWIAKPLEVDSMQKGLQFLLGEHDFKPFQASGSIVRTTVRTLFEVEVSRLPCWPGFSPVSLSPIPSYMNALETPFSYVRIRVVGSGFLKQMVRSLAGTLLQIGEGLRSPEYFLEILRTQNRALLGAVAPARALWLEKVWYEKTGSKEIFMKGLCK